MSFPWSDLGIAATGDARAVRSAYAARVKTMDLDADVEGYARLRQARDAALRLAKQIAAGEAPPPDDEDDDDFWEDEGAEGIRVSFDPFADEPLQPGWLQRASAPPEDAPTDPAPSAEPVEHGETIAAIAADPFAAPLIEGHDPAQSAGQQETQSPFVRLAALLSPGDGAEADAMDEAEEASAHALLRAVLEAVHVSDITSQEEMESWLAALLAESWPRSAPLLDEAEAAFEWNREWGKVDARPAIEYLGARLRGYRFQRKVAQKGHRYHKAWVELGRPGKAGPLRFLRASSTDVRGLLAGIRKHFPEVEEQLDPARIASWEGGSAWSTAAIVVAGMVLLGFLFGLGDPEPRSTSGGAEFAAEMRAVHEATKEALPQAFGPGRDIEWLRKDHSGLAITVDGLSQAAFDSGGGKAEAASRIVELARQRTYLNGRAMTGEDFERTMRLRLDLLKAAQAKDAATCVQFLNAGKLPAAVPVPEAVRVRERELAASFAERGLLGAPIPSGSTSATVPGALVGKVLEATKLGKERAGQAMQGKGSAEDRCAVSIALLEATLDWQGEGRRAILRTL